jgi:DNA repair protein RadA/Sms
MAKKKSLFSCESCGHHEPKWLGRCPSCGAWNSFREEAATASSGGSGGPAGSRRKGAERPASAVQLEEVVSGDGSRFTSGIAELDRVLGGGIMRGSAVLIGGEPGIGKSTLMLQLAAQVRGKVLYISGEESASQIKMRADRLHAGSASVELLCESDLDRILSVLNKNKPPLVVIDSIQTLISQEAGQVPGTVNQLKYGCHELIEWARESDAALFLVAHVTKEGSIAGPKVIEHMVDTVLYFDMADGGLRIVRSTKNRFGSVDELGLFTMEGDGLHQVEDPGKIFLVRRGGEMPSGITAAPVYEGSRVLMVELQALTVPAKGAYSRVYSDRIDPGRVNRIAAVLERHLGLRFSDQDIYVNVAGGMRIGEVGIELPLAVALYSARTGIPVPKGLTLAGEVSLAGEIRPTGHMDRRRKSAGEYGFSRFVGPSSTTGTDSKSGQKLWVEVETIGAAIKAIFGSSGSTSAAP